MDYWASTLHRHLGNRCVPERDGPHSCGIYNLVWETDTEQVIIEVLNVRKRCHGNI